MRVGFSVSLLLASVVCCAAALSTAGDAHARSDRDHERARAAVVAGEVMPLPALLERVAQQQPGHVLAVELEQERGRWIYELKLLQPGGRVLKVDVDARDGTVLPRRRDGRSERR